MLFLNIYFWNRNWLQQYISLLIFSPKIVVKIPRFLLRPCNTSKRNYRNLCGNLFDEITICRLYTSLTFSWKRSISYRKNRSIDLQRFLYDRHPRHEKVKETPAEAFITFFEVFQRDIIHFMLLFSLYTYPLKISKNKKFNVLNGIEMEHWYQMALNFWAEFLF